MNNSKERTTTVQITHTENTTDEKPTTRQLPSDNGPTVEDGSNTVSEAIVLKLLEYMGKQNLTQYRLAQKSGLSFATVKSIMQRRSKSITLKTLILLAHGLGISVSEFLDDELFSPENLNLD